MFQIIFCLYIQNYKFALFSNYLTAILSERSHTSISGSFFKEDIIRKTTGDKIRNS